VAGWPPRPGGVKGRGHRRLAEKQVAGVAGQQPWEPPVRGGCGLRRLTEK
jgi:hypothetical protein